MHTGCGQSLSKICHPGRTPKVARRWLHRQARWCCREKTRKCDLWNSPRLQRLPQNRDLLEVARNPALIGMEFQGPTTVVQTMNTRQAAKLENKLSWINL